MCHVHIDFGNGFVKCNVLYDGAPLLESFGLCYSFVSWLFIMMSAGFSMRSVRSSVLEVMGDSCNLSVVLAYICTSRQPLADAIP